MRLIINILALIGLAVGVSSMIELYMLRINPGESQGFANVAVPLWALIGSAAAIVFGFIVRIMDRRVPKPASKLSNVAIALGFLTAAATLAVPFVFN